MKGREHLLQPGSIVGRADCDIVLPDPEVSRRHAVVRDLEDELAIEDLQSKNGTFVNGEQIDGVTRLNEGDDVRFGNTMLRVSSPADATRASPSPGTVIAEPPAAPDSTEPKGAPAGPPDSPPPGPTERRGDVPAPEPAPPSAIRRVLPPAGQVAQFSPSAGGGLRRSAARRVEATAVAYAIVLATAVAVVLYFVQR